MMKDPRWHRVRRARWPLAGFGVLLALLVLAQWSAEIYYCERAWEVPYDRRGESNWLPVVASLPFCLMSWMLPVAMLAAAHRVRRSQSDLETQRDPLARSVPAARTALWVWRFLVGTLVVFVACAAGVFGLLSVF
ncbi:MAG: hypothetical protein ACJA00_005520 [Myxococcota bacterium]|jgi:hypothetical protein